MEKYRPYLFLGLAIIVGLITSIMVYNWMQKKAGLGEETLQTTPVLIAIADMPWGSAINKESVKAVPFLKGSLPEGEVFSDPASLEGRILIYPVKANEPILKSRLAPTTVSTGGVVAVLDPKKRAMAVRVDKVIGVSGFIHPGSRVDVIVTVAGEKESQPISKIVLQNIPVLATGTEMEQKGKGEKPSPVDVITLEVSPEEAEKLAHAATQGKILLALKSFENTETVQTTGVTVPILLSSQTKPAKVVTAKAPSAPAKTGTVKKPQAAAAVKPKKAHSVELIRGDAVSYLTFGGGK